MMMMMMMEGRGEVGPRKNHKRVSKNAGLKICDANHQHAPAIFFLGGKRSVNGSFSLMVRSDVEVYINTIVRIINNTH